jgi:hypothetical protein
MKMITAKAVTLILTLFLTTGTVSLVLAAEGWEANLAISVAGAENKLSFGQQTDATDALDGQYDVPPMIGGTLTSYFSDGGSLLWRDIRAFTPEIKTWKLHIESTRYDKYIYVTWEPNKLPGGAHVHLKDTISGVSLNMAERNLFAFKNMGPKDLEIVVQY